MHYIVYKTTNLINKKIYIGIHSTENINDGYLGSGTALKRAIAKHGKENFSEKAEKFLDAIKKLLPSETSRYIEVNPEGVYDDGPDIFKMNTSSGNPTGRFFYIVEGTIERLIRMFRFTVVHRPDPNDEMDYEIYSFLRRIIGVEPEDTEWLLNELGFGISRNGYPHEKRLYWGYND